MNAVSSSSTAATLGEQFGAATSAVLLWTLKSSYSHLDECLAQMELATTARKPDMASLAAARFRISQASLARRQLFKKACEHLLVHATPAEAETIRSLQRECAVYARASTEHIRDWPASRVEQDWTGYCDASRKIRAKIKQTVRTEQRLLFPLLVRYEHS